MKKIFNIMLAASSLFLFSACDNYLDINDNPNQATSATPDLVLPAAINATASGSVGFNAYGNDLVGYTVNAGGFGGFGSVWTYNYVNTEFQGLFTGSYANLRDYQYVFDQTNGNKNLIYSNAVSRIMKSFVFERLVNTYNDVPYFDALKSSTNLTPKYDAAPLIYQDLVAQLDTAITAITLAQSVSSTSLDAPVAISSASDPLFKGDMNGWKRFANTLKLRLLIKMSGVANLSSFVTTKFASFNTTLGVITDDAIVQPGYSKVDGKQSPFWNTYGFTVVNVVSGTGRSRLPSRFLLNFYSNKINDSRRGALTFRGFPSPVINQLGFEPPSGQLLAPTGASVWYLGVANSGLDGLGLIKGATAGTPILLGAEASFLLAEANLKGFISGLAATAYRAGIERSFTFVNKDVNNTSAKTAATIATEVTAYISDNVGNRLVDYAASTTDAQRLEAIITQKYIALNLIGGFEAWNEFRRTAYPTITNGSANATLSFASTQSTSTRTDKLPARILYPQDELQKNAANVPTGINQFTSRIFWDIN
ncbi:hypothetical protein A5893_10350 [Pedobacter psychrophilus]|uniref:SusD/RagB family nutrient-binding outer membrane lipoprotein n=1 Tax=Pedobacter psychrophilus TaxID=1826909 RepID=A0A179DDE1_9SPHI|nr:SusD/RagB family nutrient-binding outer membrane lipoprotein [Pedobacter psychrophilus]OAQ39067.1 hypothetical protein A5893_10350 [Pedobacter psychrophilus]